MLHKKLIVTRLRPPPEVAFWYAVLRYLSDVRIKAGIKSLTDPREDQRCRLVGIPAGSIKNSQFRHKPIEWWEKRGVVFFDTGGGKYDEHKDGWDNFCSMDVFRKTGANDFLARRPWLRRIYNMVAGNDIHGGGLSRDKKRLHIREAMGGLNDLYPDGNVGTEFVLKVVSLGMGGAMELARQFKEPEKDPFSLASMIKGLKLLVEAGIHGPKTIDVFTHYFHEGIKQSNRRYEEARSAILNARGEGKGPLMKHIEFSALPGRKVSVGFFLSDSYKAGPASRSYDDEGRGYDVAVIFNTHGHVQVVTTNIKVMGGKKLRIDMRPVAAILRMREAEIRGEPIPTDQQLMSLLHMPTENSEVWFVPKFKTGVLNGSTGNMVIEPTQIPAKEIVNLVLTALPNCPLFDAPQGV